MTLRICILKINPELSRQRSEPAVQPKTFALCSEATMSVAVTLALAPLAHSGSVSGTGVIVPAQAGLN